MREWIAFLRGINVGGKNSLPMADLRAMLTDLGLADVRTYIQSGNCAFRNDMAGEQTAALAARISAAIQSVFGFCPEVLVLSRANVADILKAFPFAAAQDDPKTGHLYFLTAPAASPDLDSLAALASPTERFALTDRCFYLFAPDGIGRSKLAAQVERHLGVPVTARNLRSVQKTLDLFG